jgi:ketosteroid isomerase-like protein
VGTLRFNLPGLHSFGGSAAARQLFDFAAAAFIATMASLEGAEIEMFERIKETKMNPSLLTTTPAGRRAISQTTEPAGKRSPRRRFQPILATGLAVGILLVIAAGRANSSPADDKKTVADLDTQYQAAVKINDAATMDRILADDYALVTGSGKIYSKADLLDEARSGRVVYDHQEDTAQTVRLWGDTAVITAKLWEKGTDSGKPFDYTVWFSDTYVRTPSGWRYVFGQSSCPCTRPPSP